MNSESGQGVSRRAWLEGIAAGATAIAMAPMRRPSGQKLEERPRSSPPTAKPPRKKLAAIVTTYFPNSHADHIVGRFLWGYQWRGQHHQPGFEVVSLYADQHPANEKIPALAKRFGFKTCANVEDALTLGSGKLAADAVLLIGEHGDYPDNAIGQKLYPRFDLFEKITGVFRASGKAVPVFNDKHLSYDFEKAKAMVAQARELGFGLMAGSSLPVTWRRPELELPIGVRCENALVAAYGPDEIYGFHALETLQCMLERRAGGETGVREVACLKGADVWKAGDAGEWSWDLLEEALGRSETLAPGDVRFNVPTPLMIQVRYASGAKGTVLLLNGHIADFNFAARVAGAARPESCLFYLPNPPGANYFSSLVNRIEVLFETGSAPYPVERTLLTGGILESALQALASGKRSIETPRLAIRYAPAPDSQFARGAPSSPVAS